jgi:2-oxo-hept-3-ene-1,7-dioate hydratase
MRGSDAWNFSYARAAKRQNPEPLTPPLRGDPLAKGEGVRVLTPAQISDAARRLDEAERMRAQIGLLSLQYPHMTLDDAYAVQTAFVALKTARGVKPRGHKIGLTSRAMQQALGIETPDSGVLLDDMFFADGDAIPSDHFIATRIEAELAFVLKAPLEGPDCTLDAVLDATDYVTPALEILDTRILRVDPASKRARNICDTVADNAANAGIVVGNRRISPREDLRWIGAVVSLNGTVEETGLAAGVLDHPAHGIAWLANRLHKQGLPPLAKGETVLSGSFIRPIEARKGDRFVADYGPWGTITCHFA